MKRYVDGFVMPIQKSKLKAYKRMAARAGKMWIKHGALQFVETVGEDLKSAKKWGCLPFPQMTKAKPNETVIFSFIVYRSRKHRDAVNAKVMKELEMDLPLDMKRSAVGGFETIINL